MGVDFVKFNSNRNPLYDITTSIEIVNGKKIVRKCASTPEACAFLKRIHENTILIKETYSCINTANVLESSDSEVIFEFIEVCMSRSSRPSKPE